MIDNIESMVVKKTNRYVYLSDGTHMTHSDFHKYKNDIRNEYARIHNTEFKDSVHEVLLLKDSLKKLERIREDLQDEISYLETDISMIKDDRDNKPDYEKWWKDESEKNDFLRNKLTSLARKVYKEYFPINNTEKDIKFILQESEEGDFRIMYDPLQFKDNSHGSLSDIFDEWHTVSGGWLRITDNEVILFGRSGDYGLYKNDITIECAKILFKGKTIISYPDQWNEPFV